MAQTPFMTALEELAEERGLPVETVIGTVEAALAAAYRKDYGKPGQLIRAKLNATDLTKTEMFQVFEILADEEEITEPERQLHHSDAQKKEKTIKVGGEIVEPLPHHADFGRIAAQTAKQVIIQRIAEAERTMLYDEFKDKEGSIVGATVQQIEGRDVAVNIGRMNAIMLLPDQVHTERYYIGQRIKVYVKGVEETNRGPKVLVSRAHPDLIRGLFRQEVPEIQAETVTVEGVAREAGSRTKIAVAAHQEGLDPVGSCVGQRGIRVQAVLSEIGDEKIDIILWDPDPSKLLANSLSPAKVDRITLDEATKKATVHVPTDQVSLAIGRGGQNVRLASKLTGWDIDIVKDQVESSPAEEESEGASEQNEVKDQDAAAAIDQTEQPTEPNLDQPSEETPRKPNV
ncbi:transcription termination/antitermination protein NusA [Candidatus Berkelbacteria bacterium]|nr:transcription termination/antitermination protein NusA [Candidatus Berkelbacteria bacterium]